MKVRFAVSATLGDPDPGRLAALVQGAEERGFDTVWFSDLPVLPATDPLLAVAFAAGITRCLKLGINVVPFGCRPFILARHLAELDRLSGGRLLVTVVPGLDTPGERQVLATAGRHRGRLIEDILPELRQWWSGRPVGEDEPVVLPVLPVQDPLEVWLGGSGPHAVRRAGRFADGWLGSLLAPDQAGAVRASIQQEAEAAGRIIDPEHFGMSIGYAHSREDLAHAVTLRRLRTEPAASIDELVPVGSAGLRELVGQLVEQGLSKFVVRPVASIRPLEEELDWLANALLDLQT